MHHCAELNNVILLTPEAINGTQYRVVLTLESLNYFDNVLMQKYRVRERSHRYYPRISDRLVPPALLLTFDPPMPRENAFEIQALVDSSGVISVILTRDDILYFNEAVVTYQNQVTSRVIKRRNASPYYRPKKQRYNAYLINLE